ncbi:hypothetical protein SAMN05443377_13410 [Propionibacterium cyclohexanicum]|uniref:Uncharacterized protein n=1 Tax=Propionibacterium cyclohexanicum TaxID=64702 RepID=A0A1H9U043_9ACTN|nr:DUF6394 family protein [Propionibacterium cyclohexanicum]SES03030.1 hypothetical protein SAMN05443377_13410 [Propionibacterium cyclohexanicum]
MNLEKVVFGFFVTLAASLNFGFFYGPLDDPTMHNGYELIAALVVSLITTVLKFGDRTQLGAVHLATSLVADLQLVVAATIWVWATQIAALQMTPTHMSVIVSMSGGALLANVVSVILMVSEIVQVRR